PRRPCCVYGLWVEIADIDSFQPRQRRVHLLQRLHQLRTDGLQGGDVAGRHSELRSAGPEIELRSLVRFPSRSLGGTRVEAAAPLWLAHVSPLAFASAARAASNCRPRGT